jgi:acyl-homoserine-lactone acylase
VRPDGLDTGRPLAGWTSKTEWLGIHPFSDLVQILNPPGGFMQNCNVSPGTMMPNSPLTAERYPGVIYNERVDRSNSRGRRALELLGSQRKLILEDALAIAVDTYVDRSDRWQRALVTAHETHHARYPSLIQAVELLKAWDGYMNVASRAAPLFRFWMRACREDDANVPRKKISDGAALSDDEQIALLDAFERAVESLEQVGEVGLAWGELHRIRRGTGSWPVAGCRADGISTLRSVRFSSPDAEGISWARGGQICTTVVVLTEGNVVSFSATPYGQSNDPRSPNYADQTELLFSRSQLKPTWFAKSDLLEHVQSKRTLTLSLPHSGSDDRDSAPAPAPASTPGSPSEEGL